MLPASSTTQPKNVTGQVIGKFADLVNDSGQVTWKFSRTFASLLLGKDNASVVAKIVFGTPLHSTIVIFFLNSCVVLESLALLKPSFASDETWLIIMTISQIMFYPCVSLILSLTFDAAICRAILYQAPLYVISFFCAGLLFCIGIGNILSWDFRAGFLFPHWMISVFGMCFFDSIHPEIRGKMAKGNFSFTLVNFLFYSIIFNFGFVADAKTDAIIFILTTPTGRIIEYGAYSSLNSGLSVFAAFCLSDLYHAMMFDSDGRAKTTVLMIPVNVVREKDDLVMVPWFVSNNNSTGGAENSGNVVQAMDG
jgi:hypothetical protein